MGLLLAKYNDGSAGWASYWLNTMVGVHGEAIIGPIRWCGLYWSTRMNQYDFEEMFATSIPTIFFGSMH